MSYYLDIAAFVINLMMLVGIAISLYRWRGFPSGMLVANTKLVRLMLCTQLCMVVAILIWIGVAHLRLLY
jgi:hypothetical protein